MHYYIKVAPFTTNNTLPKKKHIGLFYSKKYFIQEKNLNKIDKIYKVSNEHITFFITFFDKLFAHCTQEWLGQ